MPIGKYASDFHVGIRVANGGFVVMAWAEGDDGEFRYETSIANDTQCLSRLVVRYCEPLIGPGGDESEKPIGGMEVGV